MRIRFIKKIIKEHSNNTIQIKLKILSALNLHYHTEMELG